MPQGARAQAQRRAALPPMAAVGSQRGLDSVRRTRSDPNFYTGSGRVLESTLSRIRTRDQSGRCIYSQNADIFTDKHYLPRKAWERYSRTTWARAECRGLAGVTHLTKRHLAEAPKDRTRQHHGPDGWNETSWLHKHPALPQDDGSAALTMARTHSCLTLGRPPSVSQRIATPAPRPLSVSQRITTPGPPKSYV